MALSTKYRSNPYVQRDTTQNLTIMRKAFANNIAQTVNGVVELSRYIASVSAYISSNRLSLGDMALASVNKNVTINLLEEHGWDHRCSTTKDINTSNLFTAGRGIPTTKTVAITQSLGSSSISSSKTISQLMTQRNTLSQNALITRDCLGYVSLSNAQKTTNAISGKKIMGANAFSNCVRLASVRASSDNAWNGFYSDGCFKSCASLTTANTVSNSNSSMSMNVGVTPPVGTISVVLGSDVVNGSSTQFTSTTSVVFSPGQMLYTSSDTREGAIYIGTIKSIQSNTKITLVLPSVLTYTGTFRLTTEAMVSAHATSIGKETFRGTNVSVISVESHLNAADAASNSKILTIGTNFCTDCPNLATVHFAVKQNTALSRIGAELDVIPLTTKLSVLTSDDWSPPDAQTQLANLFLVATSRFTTSPKFTGIFKAQAATDSTGNPVTNSNGDPITQNIVTITGFAYSDQPLYLRNLVIPEYLTHTDGKMYQVYDIDYPFIDQVETITGQPNRIYGAFSKSNPAFASVGALSGTLTLPKTLRKIGSNSFAYQGALSGNLTITAPLLSMIAERAFVSSYATAGRKTLTILYSPKIILNQGAECFNGTSFFTTNIAPMSDLQMIQYSF